VWETRLLRGTKSFKVNASNRQEDSDEGFTRWPAISIVAPKISFDTQQRKEQPELAPLRSVQKSKQRDIPDLPVNFNKEYQTTTLCVL
jgi:hypothetical protein